MANWTNRFMKQAKMVASWSKDTNTKVGAVIVDKDKIVVSIGYNGFPRGCDDSIESRYEKPMKYLFTEHAERNAIYHAARLGVSLKETTIYVTMFPCCDCARAIIQSGVIEIIAPEPDLDHEKWGESFKASLKMFAETGVSVKYYTV